LELDKGSVFLRVDRNKKANYRIFKPEERSTEKTFQINLKNLEIHNFQFLVNNEFSGTLIKGTTDKTKLNIKSSEIELQSNFLVYNFRHKNKVLAKNRKGKTNITFVIEEKKYIVSSGSLYFMDLGIDFTGSFASSEKPGLDLEFEVVNQKAGNLLEIPGGDLPGKYELKTSPSGLKIDGSVRGEISREKAPHIDLNFTLENGTFYFKNSKSSLSKLSLKGNYNNGIKNNLSTTKILIEGFTAHYSGNDIRGSYALNNLEKPQFELSLVGDMDLFEIQKLIPSISHLNFQGLAHANITLSGDLNDFRKITLNDFEKFKPAGHIELNNVSLEAKLNSLLFRKVSGSIMLGKHFWLDDIKGYLNGSPIVLSGEVRNILSFLNNKKQSVVIQGDLYSPDLKLSAFIHQKKIAKNNDSSSGNLHFPEYIIAKIELHADSLSLGKFSSESFHGTLFYEPSKLYFNSLSFNSMHGLVEGNCQVFSHGENSLIIQAQSNFSNINIYDLFASMNNFGQNFITGDNLKGEISGEVNFYSVWADNLRIRKESIVAESDFVIINGELNHFQPIQSLSKFIAVEEFENIRFSELKNIVYVTDEKVIIPKMDIHSSAFNITAAGTHNFNNTYDYHLKVLLSEILAAKAKRAKKENKEFGIVEDDGLGKTSLFFKISGSPDSVVVSYDRKEMINSVKENIQAEKETMKTIFKEEFGRAKADTAPSTTGESKRFQIVWDEEVQSPRDTIKSKTKNLNISWEEETDSTIIKYY
ncbi:MAG: AsmA-like C-terminal region-containing protein, partial [Bacteroidota bacterium]|nr:AsmA-like C-terminal region-containing protein [Bacteroidota bacterium]